MLYKFRCESPLHKFIKGILSGLRQFLATESPLKMIKNAFFYLKSSFLSQDIEIFVLTFGSCRKTA